MLELLLQCVQAEYAGDPTVAGVSVAFITSGWWYCAVVRYTGTLGQGKRVVCSIKANTLDEAVRKVALAWTGEHAPKVAKLYRMAKNASQ